MSNATKDTDFWNNLRQCWHVLADLDELVEAGEIEMDEPLARRIAVSAKEVRQMLVRAP